MNISEIDWGDDSAEKDSNLLRYFITSKSFQRIAEKRKSIVVGRKGSGKSALLKKLEDHFRTQEKTIVIRVAPKFNTLRAVLNDQNLQESFGEEIFFQHTWLRQLYLDFLCSIGHREKGAYVSGSIEYARGVAKELNRTSKDIAENITEVLAKLRVKCGDLGEFGLSIEKELKESTDLDTLEHHVCEIASAGTTFIALIDDLDLGWNNSEIANNLLLGLLSAVTYISGLDVNIYPILFLREDVYTILLTKTQHSDKYRDIEKIRWEKEQLMELLHERINFNRIEYGIEPVENSIFSVFPNTIGTTNVDNWLVDKTLSRPRELIQLARYYTQDLDQPEPSDKRLKDSEPEYSNWKLDDLCAEYSNQYSGLGSIVTYWKTKFFRRKYHFKKPEIEEMILEIMADVTLDTPWFNSLVDSTNVEGLLSVLYEIGLLGDFILGGSGGSKTYYSYQGFHEPRFEEVQIHPCFRKALNTVERNR